MFQFQNIAKILFVVVLVLLIPTESFCQLKYEKESRVRAEHVVEGAKSFIDSLKILGKIKWYYEENFTGNSYEAKFIVNKENFSVEFDTLGNIQDVEIVTDFQKLKNPIRKKILGFLGSSFDHYRVNKIQVQYLGERGDLQQLVLGKSEAQSLTMNYEIVVRGKKERETKLYEFTFTEKGDLQKSSEIVLKNSDNLEF